LLKHWRVIIYWTTTIVVANEMAAVPTWDLLRIDYVRAVLAQLGYPLYLLTIIIGVCKLPCAFTLLAPGCARLKEWAYSGAFFNYSGAAASHILAHDPKRWFFTGPAALAAITLASWSLLPEGRRAVSTPTPSPTRPRVWVLAGIGTLAMVVFALFTLPKGIEP
jgi:hypothetical protein